MTKLHISSAAVLLLIILLCATFVSADDTATIILKNGQSFENVEYRINDYYKTVDLKIAEGDEIRKKSASFSDIQAIIDPDGHNIAPELLGGWYRPRESLTREEEKSDEIGNTTEGSPPVVDITTPSSDDVTPDDKPKWKSENDPVYTRARLPRWNTGLRLATDLSVPIGNWYSGVKTGVGFESDFFIAVSNNLALRFHFSRAGLNVDDDFLYFPLPPGYRIISRESSIAVLRYLVYLQYNQVPLEKRPGILSYHASAGMGAISHKISGKITFEEISSGDSYRLEGDDSMMDFMISSIIGLTYTVSGNIALDGSLSVDYPFIRADDKLAEAYIIDFKFGILLLF